MEQEVCDDLAMGRTPVREALQRLAMEKLIRSIPREGMKESRLRVKWNGCSCGTRGVLIGVGSDHTDRKPETHAIPKAKNLCLNVMDATLWPYEEVKEHFDQLILACQVEIAGEDQPYQALPCGAILDPDYWIPFLKRQIGGLEDGLVFFSGTIGTVDSLKTGETYRFSLKEPVLGHILNHHYTCPVLTGAVEDY